MMTEKLKAANLAEIVRTELTQKLLPNLSKEKIINIINDVINNAYVEGNKQNISKKCLYLALSSLFHPDKLSLKCPKINEYLEPFELKDLIQKVNHSFHENPLSFDNNANNFWFNFSFNFTFNDYTQEGEYYIEDNDFDKLHRLLVAHSPDSNTLNSFMKAIVRNKRWDLAKKLCASLKVNEKNQKSIEFLLEKTITDYNIDEDIIIYLFSLVAKNNPNSVALESSLIALVKKKHKSLFIKILEINDNINKISPENIDIILKEEVNCYSPDDNFITYLCSLPSVSDKVLNDVLVALVNKKHWDAVKKIIEVNQKTNKIFQKNIDAIVKKEISHYSIDDNFIACLCSLPSISDEVLNEALIKLADSACWEALKKILEVNNTTKKISQENIEDILKRAISNYSVNWDFILCALSTINKFPKEISELLLSKAVQAEQLQIIQAIYSLPENCIPGEESLESALHLAIDSDFLNIVRFFCKIKTTTNDPACHFDSFKPFNSSFYYPNIRQCLLKADRILTLHKSIAVLEAHGKKLSQSNESREQGEMVISLTDKLTLITNQYAFAFFDEQDTQHLSQEFSATLQAGFEQMGDHRKKWKITLANIMIAATGVGLLINYLVNGHVFFSNTERQNKIENIMSRSGILEENNLPLLN